jgi:hypothetical protein
VSGFHDYEYDHMAGESVSPTTLLLRGLLSVEWNAAFHYMSLTGVVFFFFGMRPAANINTVIHVFVVG